MDVQQQFLIVNLQLSCIVMSFFAHFHPFDIKPLLGLGNGQSLSTQTIIIVG